MSSGEPPIEGFATLVQETLDRRTKVSSLWSLIVTLVITGAVFTSALHWDANWLYTLGCVLTVVWVAGFFLARGEARWFRW